MACRGDVKAYPAQQRQRFVCVPRSKQQRSRLVQHRRELQALQRRVLGFQCGRLDYRALDLREATQTNVRQNVLLPVGAPTAAAAIL